VIVQNEPSEAGNPAVAKRPRGKWTAQQRRRIVADSHVAGASIHEVARRHGVRANLLSAWRRRQDQSTQGAKKVKSIEIDLVAGCVRIRGIVDGTMLREVLAAAR